MADAALMRLWKKYSLYFAFLIKFVVPFALRHGKNLNVTVVLGFGRGLNFQNHALNMSHDAIPS